MMMMTLRDKYDTYIVVPIYSNIDFFGALRLFKTTCFDLAALRFTQVNYGVNTLKVQCIGSGLHITIKIKSNLHYTRRITPKRVTSCGAHLRGLAPGLHSSEEASQRWRVVGDTVPI